MKAEWAQLHHCLRPSTFFLCEAWVDSWLAVFGADVRVDLWTVRAGEQLVGGALLVRRLERRGPVPLRCVYLNTSGEGADSVTVEHNAVLCRHGFEDAVWDELNRLLHRMTWDELRLEGGTEETWRRLCDHFPEWKREQRTLPSPSIRLDQVRRSEQGLFGVISANSRAQLRRAERAAARRGSVEVDEAITKASRLSMWRELASIHTARWQGNGLPGAFSRARWRAFHERLLDRCPRETRLFRLRVGDQTMAIIYVLQHGAHGAFYQSGVQRGEVEASIKPGLLLHADVIGRFASEGLAEYDFLASEPGAVRYKRSLATAERSLYWGRVIRPTVRSRLVAGLRSARTIFARRRG